MDNQDSCNISLCLSVIKRRRIQKRKMDKRLKEDLHSTITIDLEPGHLASDLLLPRPSCTGSREAPGFGGLAEAAAPGFVVCSGVYQHEPNMQPQRDPYNPVFYSPF